MNNTVVSNKSGMWEGSFECTFTERHETSCSTRVTLGPEHIL